MKSVIAIDMGTTHIKATLYGIHGELIGEEKCQTPLVKEPLGMVYDPEEIWKIVKGQLDTLLKIMDQKPLGICITGMAEAGLIVHKERKEPMTPILPWFDKRTVDLASQITETEDINNFKTTGLRNSFKYGVYKFLWLLNDFGIHKKEAIWLSMCDYIGFRLTGKFVTDPTFAARTYVYDVMKKEWDKERIENFGLSLGNFPEVIESGQSFGEYHGALVALCGHDHICAAFGLLYEDPSRICDSAGTSETYVGIIKEPLEFPNKSGLLYGPYVDGGYFYMANVPSSGHSVEWFRKKIQLEELSYKEMNHQLEKLSKEPTKILYGPFLTGMGTPWFKSNMNGAILGLREEHDGAMVLKGMLEGIQYQAKWLLNLVEEFHNTKGSSLICAGGSVHNKVMMDLKAQILGLKVAVPVVTEATLTGAAALFLDKNFDGTMTIEFLKGPCAIKEQYHPDPLIKDQYQRIYETRYLPFIKLLAQQLQD